MDHFPKPYERGLGQILSHQIRDLKPSGNVVHDNVPVLHRLTQQVELGHYLLCATRKHDLAGQTKCTHRVAEELEVVDVDSSSRSRLSR